MLMYKRLYLSFRNYVYVCLKSTKSYVYSKEKQACLVYVINIDLDKVGANCMFGFLHRRMNFELSKDHFTIRVVDIFYLTCFIEMTFKICH